MTDANIEQQGEPKRPREHSEAADSSYCNSGSESSTDTEMGFVDVCTILLQNSEAEVQGGGGPVMLDLTKWDFNKADCRTKCRKLLENSKPLLLIGSPIEYGGGDKKQTRAVLHLAFICELYEIQVRKGRYFSSHTFALRRQLGLGNSGGFHEQVPR